jgi:uncharacterized protein (UPF0332 family)
MGNDLNPRLKKLLEERKLTRITPDRKLVLKEIAASKSDLADAKESLGLNKFKWATIQGYYSMFHSARALLFHKGYREKSHWALLVAIEELYVNEIERSLILEFEHGMYLRQEADYGLKFSERGAQEVIGAAGRLLERARAVLRTQ